MMTVLIIFSFNNHHDLSCRIMWNRNKELDGSKEKKNQHHHQNTSSVDDDATQLTITLRMTQIAGVVPLVYGMLLDSQVFSKSHHESEEPPTQTPKHTLVVAEICLSLLNHVALLDLQMLQVFFDR